MFTFLYPVLHNPAPKTLSLAGPPTTRKALGECCPGLQRLDVKGCDGVTDVGLAWMSSGCPALEYLDVSGCVKVRKACGVPVHVLRGGGGGVE